MAATRGPVPKRTTERRRRNQDEPVTTGVAGTVTTAPAASEHWAPLARDWYESLASSGQSQFYEPSDWQYARVVAELITRGLEGERLNGQLFSTIDSMMASLLTTEGDRRRVRVELEKPDPAAAAAKRTAKVTHLNAYRRKASG